MEQLKSLGTMAHKLIREAPEHLGPAEYVASIEDRSVREESMVREHLLQLLKAAALAPTQIAVAIREDLIMLEFVEGAPRADTLVHAETERQTVQDPLARCLQTIFPDENEVG